MLNDAKHYLITLFAMLVLVIGSVASASMIAPDPSDVSRIELSVLGFTAQDICGEVAGQEHHCPFCHLVPSVDTSVLIGSGWRMSAKAIWWLSSDIHKNTLACDYSRIVRAPPVLS
ncbi:MULTISPECIES: hypothetical protein [Pacificibacter]|uniref:hypothetical protein n=1 Tax=Pacificibacter TaxID=1042323 RepID=UPI001C0A054D|nr:MULTISPECIES: hypothetical protein [Pacificibacter]MBU2934561.1 hypothetical protein [Pacificibacter marinus]MDO6617292.1 hypothetical protein [Pacificibacter sp. 1_MG-2023]